MIVVDTNVLVHAANSAAVEHAPALAWIEARRAGVEPWGTTWSVVYEFLRVVTHPRVLQRPFTIGDAWTFVEALASSPSFRFLVPSERHAEVLSLTLTEVPRLAGNVVHDLHTAVLMRENGAARIATNDMDFHRFPFVEVLDPLRA